MKNLCTSVALILSLTSFAFAQTLAARITNARVVGSDFKWDIEINRTDDWGTGGGNDILGNCDFYFYVNVNGFTSSNPVVSNIHSSLDGNPNYSFATGRSAGGSQCYVALSYDQFGFGTNWYPPLNSWQLLFTVTLTISNSSENSGLAWNESSTGFSRANNQPLTAVLSINGSADISLPVQLVNFSAINDNGLVKLSWVTESELDNLGFEILRSNSENDNYAVIASYADNEALEGSGNSSVQKSYAFVDNTLSEAGTYWYKLVDVDYAGRRTEHDPVSVSLSVEDIKNISGGLPTAYQIYQNYPNPFNPTTTLSFDIPQQMRSGTVNLSVYDITGRRVRTLYQEAAVGGTYQITWDGRNTNGRLLASGIYYAVLKTTDFSKAIKMTLLK